MTRKIFFGEILLEICTSSKYWPIQQNTIKHIVYCLICSKNVLPVMRFTPNGTDDAWIFSFTILCVHAFKQLRVRKSYAVHRPWFETSHADYGLRLRMINSIFIKCSFKTLINQTWKSTWTILKSKCIYAIFINHQSNNSLQKCYMK